MKKIAMIVILLLMCTGCVNLTELSEEQIISNSIKNNAVGGVNQYRTGYKYYLPKGLTVYDKQDYNEIARSGMYKYFIYIDVVSYFNKVQESYNMNNEAVLSIPINYGQKFGYIEINEGNGNYLIEIMYNYAKIEVIVKKSDVKIAVSNAISILASIKYNDQIVSSLMGDNNFKLKEIEFNIFETKKDVQSDYLQSIEDYGQYEEPVHDQDLIK